MVFLSRTSSSFGEWAFVREYEPCDCGPHPQRMDIPLHLRHFKGGANLIPGARKWHYILAEVAGAVAVLHGIGMWSTPSMFIVGGLAAIIAVEVRA